MRCAEVQDRLSAYYDGELSSDLCSAVDAHLESCEHCAQELDRFRELSALAQKLNEPEPPADLWPELERALDEQHRESSVTLGNIRAWLFTPRTALAATVAAVFVAVGLAWWMYRAGQGPHDHLAVDFAAYVDEFQDRPQAAQQLLLARYPGKPVELEEAASELGYVPAVAHGLPEDYLLDTVYVWDMPCCKCVQSVCTRRDGTTVAIFEHNEDQPTWFGRRPSVDVHCNGRPCKIFEVESQLAASWTSGRRRITVVGLRDVNDVSELVAQLGEGDHAATEHAPG